MKVFNRLVLVLLMMGMATYSFGQGLSSSTISKTGTTVAQFLKIGVSARSIGMGGAFVAVADDASSLYLNPAGIAKVYGYEAMFTHTSWIAGTEYSFGALSMNLGGFGALGLMVGAFSSGEMDVRTVEQPDGTGERFSAQDFLVGVSYARNLTNTFSIGFSAKYIYQRLWHMSASSIAADVGILFNTPIWGINLGASIRNFGSKMQLDGRDIKFARDPDNRNYGNVNIVNSQYEMLAYALPLYFQVGLSKDVFTNEYHRLTVAVDAITPNDNYEAVNTGFEYGWKEMFFVRAGYKSLFQADSEESFTGGFGLNLRIMGTTKLKLDYAYAEFGRLEKAERFTLSIHF